MTHAHIILRSPGEMMPMFVPPGQPFFDGFMSVTLVNKDRYHNISYMYWLTDSCWLSWWLIMGAKLAAIYTSHVDHADVGYAAKHCTWNANLRCTFQPLNISMETGSFIDDLPTCIKKNVHFFHSRPLKLPACILLFPNIFLAQDA